MDRGGFFAIDSLASVHVLLVDGDASFRELLGSLLRYCGALVTAVTTTEQALIAMDEVKPDVVVFTLAGAGSLPRRIRARKPEDGGVVPIVAVLRDGASEHTPDGVTAHVTEPFNPWELCRAISALLTTG